MALLLNEQEELYKLYKSRSKTTLTHLNSAERGLLERLVKDHPTIYCAPSAFSWRDIEELTYNASYHALRIQSAKITRLCVKEKTSLQYLTMLYDHFYEHYQEMYSRKQEIVEQLIYIWEKRIVRRSLRITQLQNDIHHIHIVRRAVHGIATI